MDTRRPISVLTRAAWSVFLGLVYWAPPAAAQDAGAPPPRPPESVTVEDHPNDDGSRLDVRWELSPDDTSSPDERRVDQYLILRRNAGPDADTDDEFRVVGDATQQSHTFTDESCQFGQPYVYRVVAVYEGVRSTPVESEVVQPQRQWWNDAKSWFAVLLLLVGGSVVFFIFQARRGRELKVRQIAGLDAVTEAVGRATEMGRPCLFVPGIQDINNIQTVAGITILSRVANIAAQYDAKIEVPTARSLVMTTARETVEAAYLAAGRPDAYNEDDIYYLTDEQFGYVAGVTGTMVREEPAACFYMGAFYAESLILAEMGNSVGAIQVAGTAMPAQLPFFVAACDYTLIGEEFFAASAYLSGEPQQLGSLKGQDVGKFIGGVLILLGCAVATLQSFAQSDALLSVLAFLKDNMLGNEGFLP